MCSACSVATIEEGSVPGAMQKEADAKQQQRSASDDCRQRMTPDHSAGKRGERRAECGLGFAVRAQRMHARCAAARSLLSAAVCESERTSWHRARRERGGRSLVVSAVCCALGSSMRSGDAAVLHALRWARLVVSVRFQTRCDGGSTGMAREHSRRRSTPPRDHSHRARLSAHSAAPDRNRSAGPPIELE